MHFLSKKGNYCSDSWYSILYCFLQCYFHIKPLIIYLFHLIYPWLSANKKVPQIALCFLWFQLEMQLVNCFNHRCISIVLINLYAQFTNYVSLMHASSYRHCESPKVFELHHHFSRPFNMLKIFILQSLQISHLWLPTVPKDKPWLYQCKSLKV